MVRVCSGSILAWCESQGLHCEENVNFGWHRDNRWVARGEGSGMGVFALMSGEREVIPHTGVDPPDDVEEEKEVVGETTVFFKNTDSSFPHSFRYTPGQCYLVEGVWFTSAQHRFECPWRRGAVRLGWCLVTDVLPAPYVIVPARPAAQRPPPAPGTRTGLRSDPASS